MRHAPALCLSYARYLLGTGLILLSFASCTPSGTDTRTSARLYQVEVLARNIDPTIIPDPLAADFDGDGRLDQLTITDSSVSISLTNGVEHRFAIRDPGAQSPRIWDADVISLRRDGMFPSILLATSPEPSHEGYPVTQQLIYNDSGKLFVKRLGTYPASRLGRDVWPLPMRALGLDCAWLKSSELPVCFYASMEDGAYGVSRLVALDPDGYTKMASDPALMSDRAGRIERRWEWFRREAMDSAEMASITSPARDVVWDWYRVDSLALNRFLLEYLPMPGATMADTLLAVLRWLRESDARRQAQTFLHLSREELDSIIAELPEQPLDSPAGLSLAVALWRLDREAAFSQDITREYRLPWPAQAGHAGPNADGSAMMDAVFTDFTGDGLLDLVVVGQHSRPFSAVQHPDGYYIHQEYRAEPDEYVRVSAPPANANPRGDTPPCVYFGMEKSEEEAWRSDYVACYDHAANEWYELDLPGGPYWTEYNRVVFWDEDGDDRLDFAARGEDGSWVLLTLTEK